MATRRSSRDACPSEGQLSRGSAGCGASTPPVIGDMHALPWCRSNAALTCYLQSTSPPSLTGQFDSCLHCSLLSVAVMNSHEIEMEAQVPHRHASSAASPLSDTESPPDEDSQGFSLAPVDGGKDAWLCLLASFLLEALLWGALIRPSHPSTALLACGFSTCSLTGSRLRGHLWCLPGSLQQPSALRGLFEHRRHWRLLHGP